MNLILGWGTKTPFAAEQLSLNARTRACMSCSKRSQVPQLWPDTVSEWINIFKRMWLLIISIWVCSWPFESHLPHFSPSLYFICGLRLPYTFVQILPCFMLWSSLYPSDLPNISQTPHILFIITVTVSPASPAHSPTVPTNMAASTANTTLWVLSVPHLIISFNTTFSNFAWHASHPSVYPFYALS